MDVVTTGTRVYFNEGLFDVWYKWGASKILDDDDMPSADDFYRVCLDHNCTYTESTMYQVYRKVDGALRSLKREYDIYQTVRHSAPEGWRFSFGVGGWTAKWVSRKDTYLDEKCTTCNSRACYCAHNLHPCPKVRSEFWARTYQELLSRMMKADNRIIPNTSN